MLSPPPISESAMKELAVIAKLLIQKRYFSIECQNFYIPKLFSHINKINRTVAVIIKWSSWRTFSLGEAMIN